MTENPKWYTEQEKIPHWLSIALLNHTAPHLKWTPEKQEIGERLTQSIKQYAESYGWSDKVKEQLFKPKFPEDNDRYYMEVKK